MSATPPPQTGAGLFGYLNRRRRDVASWNIEKDAELREMISAANDGIISSAAIIQGLLSGGATGHEAVIGVLALIIIGMVASAATQYSEVQSERDAQIRIVEEEQAALITSPEAEHQELVEIYRKKGLSDELAHSVATELMANDPLRAQLDDEYGLGEIAGRWAPWTAALRSAGAFLVGSALPLLFLLILPWHIRGEITVVSVLVALALSGWIGHLVDHSSPWRSMVRTMLVGVIILGISTLAGSLVTF
ncbi:MAG: VIT1/CCC1 transporter family protein [Scrofimicrobium sp.]